MIGATTVVAALQSSLDRIWRVPTQAISGFRRFVRRRLLTFALVLAVGFLLTVSLTISAGLALFGGWWGHWFAGNELLLQVLNLLLGWVVVTSMFALIYKILPSTPIRWRDVWIGAMITSLLFSIGKSLIGAYLGHAAVASSYGAAGTLVAVIVWVYYSAQIFLYGAEFTHEIAQAAGSAPAERPQRAISAE